MTYAQPVADPTAVMGRRIGAYLVDGAIALTLLLVVVGSLFANKFDTTTLASSTAASDYCSRMNDDTLDDLDETGGTNRNQLPADAAFCFNIDNKAYVIQGDEVNAVLGQFYVLGYLVGGLNTVLLQGLAGATIGKFLFGLRTVRQDGNRAGVGWCLLREVVGLVDGFCCGIVGLIVAFNTKGHRRIGDMAASTYVVDKAAKGAPIQVPGAAPAYSPAAAAWSQPPATTWGTPTSPANPDPDGPTWDPVRNAYIQFDREADEWVQWNDDQKAWRPIDR